MLGQLVNRVLQSRVARRDPFPRHSFENSQFPRMKAAEANRDNVFSAQEGKRVFARLNRYLNRVSKHVDIRSIHRFRTNSRRVEALVAELVSDSASKRKLLKQLSKLRKKA